MPPRNAETMLSRDVHNAVDHSVTMAIKNPHAHPANKEVNSQEKVNKSVPAEANTLLNPALIPIASNRPKQAPMMPASVAITTPSITACARTSERVTPIARITPSSLRLASANIKTIVNTSKIPAAMVKVPNTKNIPDITPEDCAAALAASIFTAVNCKLMSALSERSSSQAERLDSSWTEFDELDVSNSPPAMMIIERSSGPAADNCSA